jgi:hypothetical protein
MRKPIFLAILNYKISNKKTIRKNWLDKKDELFILTDKLEELNYDNGVLSKLAKKNNKNLSDININIISIEIQGQFGMTNDRF